MYSESNFKEFSNKLFSLQKEEEARVTKKTEDIVKQRKTEAAEDAEYFRTKKETELQEEIDDLRREKIFQIDIKNRQRYNRILNDASHEIREYIKTYIEENFDRYASCFVRYIAKRYKKGTIEIYKRFQGLENFDVKETAERHIVFRSANRILKMDIDSIMREYKELIKQEISKELEK